MRQHSVAAALLACSACHYDLSDVYVHDSADGGVRDAATGVERSVENLIELWREYPTVDEECTRCARELCAQTEQTCRTDPMCLAYTECVARTPNPAGIAGCRARFGAWVSAEDVRSRDLIGPYGQCVFRDVCAAQCDGNTDLSCAGKYAWPSTASATVPMRLILTDAQSQSTPLPQVSVKACRVADALACTGGEVQGITNEHGVVELSLPTSFDRAFTGYFELQGQGIYPTLLKFSWNVAIDSTQVVNVVNKELFTYSIKATGVPPDPTRGMVQPRMLGCQGVGVRGVHFGIDSADPLQKIWYIADGVPRFTAVETNAVGSGGIVDVPEGRRMITATRTGETTPVARVEAPVRVGFMTVVVFAPVASN